MHRISFFIAAILTFLWSSTFAIDSLNDIQVGGVYRMELTTGDIIEGIVEMKNDTGLVIESQGTPYTFKAELIDNYSLLEAPKVKSASEETGPDTLSYDALLHKSIFDGKIELTITNGTVFSGRVSTIDSQVIKIDVGGSIIPIERKIVSQIVTIPLNQNKAKAKQDPVEQKKFSGPYDTVYVLEKQTTDWGGDTLVPVMIIGIIQNYDITGVTMQTPTGLVRQFKKDRIYRVNMHSAPSYEQLIQTYAKPLTCGEGQMLIDLPPTMTEGKPFFKVCMDRYEFPNKREVTPQTNTTFDAAQQTCKSQGKRLCTTLEWQWACSGRDGLIYPYGNVLDKELCNRDGMSHVETSGNRVKCAGRYGVYDMVGNVFEWVVDPDGKPQLMGGPMSKCQTVSPGESTAAKPQIGFRCCKGN